MLSFENNQKNTHAQKVIAWRENLATLPDDRFFEIVHMYLGEIKTPYNKQKLIEQLGAFLHKEQNRQNIALLLDDFDKQLITAVSVIPDATQSRLADFFSGSYTLSEVYSRLVNLRERLIIYNEKREGISQPIQILNPVLEDILLPCVNLLRILPPAEYAEHNNSACFSLSPQFIAAFSSYINEHPELYKADGTIKKNDSSRLEQIFPGLNNALQLLLNAFMNLSLSSPERLAAFAELSDKKQYAYLCAAASGRLSREGLRSQAQLLLDCASSIPPEGFSRPVLLRTAFLLASHRDSEEIVQGRFSRIVEENRASASDIYEEGERAGLIIDRIIDAAETFGLVQNCGKTPEGDIIYQTGPALSESFEYTENPKVINIDAGFTVTLMPGLPLKKLLPLTAFLSIKRFNTAVEFEITRQSVIHAFDKGFTARKIYELLEQYTSYSLPQNLHVTIDDWQNSYSSAMMYKGYVLKLDEKNASLLEKNPNAAKYIRTKLASGIYLMDMQSDEDVDAFILGSGLDFIGSIKGTERSPATVTFPLLTDGRNFIPAQTQQNENQKQEYKKSDTVLNSFRNILKNMDIQPLQKEGLSQRIDRKIIITEEQLRPASVHTEILEADGMDFLGKVRLAETAEAAHDMIEITVPADNDASSLITYMGTPLQITKKTGEAMLKLQLEPSGQIQFFQVSRLNRIKWLKQL